MSADRPVIRGRGASHNPANRFEQIDYIPDSEEAFELDRPRTEFYMDLSRTIISTNNSPDINFDSSINPYRGCEHGCVYCYARPTHEYLGWSAGLDFETKILVKRNAADLLRDKLNSKSWRPQVLMLSGVTDPYQPAERKMRVTRSVLEVLAEFRNPVALVTKNHLVTRDIDLLGELAGFNAAGVTLSITSLDAKLTSKLEPRTSHPKKKLEAVRKLADAGVPVGVFVAPIIPGLNDRDVPKILRAAADAGASYASFVTLRLPHGLAPMFEEWLDAHMPDRKQRILARVRDMRGGKLNESQFGARMRGSGEYAEQIRALFTVHCRRLGLNRAAPDLSTDAFRRPRDAQLELF